MRNEPEQQIFLEAIAKLFLAFPQRDQSEETTALRAEIYTEALEPYRSLEVALAVRRIIAEPGRVWLPTPGELIDRMLEVRRVHRLERDTEARTQRQLTESAEAIAEARGKFKTLVAELTERFKARRP